MFSHRYSCYGLTLTSNVPLPNISDCDGMYGGPLVAVSLREEALFQPPAAEPWYVSDHREQRGDPALQVWQQGDEYHLIYWDGAAFTISCSAVRGCWFGPGTFENTVSYLLGPVLALVLRLQGVMCLHASGVCDGEGAVVFVGPPEAGKSSIAAAFVRSGWKLLADDLVPVSRRQGWSASSGYPGLRLWAESAAIMYGKEARFPRSSPTWGKYLVEHRRGFAEGETPLRAIFILEPRGDSSAIATQIGGTAAVMRLVENTYLNYLPCPKFRRQSLETIAEIAQEIPVLKITLLDRLDQLIDAVAYITEQLEGLADWRTVGS